MTRISIVIPTYKRPDNLSRLLDSIHADIGARDDVDIIVVDNDVAQSAQSTVKTFSDRVGRPINYRVAPDPGVSNARNAGMDAVSTRYVLFLDDDMEVVTPFLKPMLETSRTLGTTLTFAGVIAELPESQRHLSRWLVPLFSHVMDGGTRIVDETLGTGGCLVDLDKITLPSPVFDPALNEVGGEDDAFFGHIRSQGVAVGWCAEAKALEHVPPHRATAAYLWQRHFAFGQTPTREAADKGVSGLPEIAKWMIVGGVQTALHGTLYLVHRLLGRPSRIEHMGRLAQGLGKMFWWDSLSPRFYGANAR